MLEKYELFQFDFRGKCKFAMEGLGCGMLNMWALRNTNGKKVTVVRNAETKEITMVVQGNGKDFPTIIRDKEEIENLGINIFGEDE